MACGWVTHLYIYIKYKQKFPVIAIQGAYTISFQVFFRMSTFIASTHMKL